MGRPRDDLGPLPPSPPRDRVHIQRPPPRHTQTDYHLNQAPPPSPQTRKHPHTVQLPFLQPHSWFKGLHFKWSSGNFNVAPFAFHDGLRPRHCHACPDPHPMDAISFVSHCLTCEHLVQTYIQCGRPPFTMMVSQWWSATTHVGERRNFVWGLVPMSLYTKLTTPPSGRGKPAHCHDLKLALMARVPLLLNALYRTLEWLNDHPSPAPLTPPHGLKPMEAPLVALQHVTHRPTAPPPPRLSPPPLPDKVAHKPPKRPRPPSPAAHAKSQKHARQPPRPVRPLSLKRSTASQPQPEPPPPYGPLTIRDMFNPPPPSTSPPPRHLRPRLHPFSPHHRVLRTSPPLPREHKLTIVLTFVQRVISLKKPHLYTSLTPALDSPNTVQAISTTTLALTSHFCK